ncbi:MAG TPA: PadR family transcriptional regulator [Longimicrobiales bacterium]|nr:PadR family transcriptional regulator [Longimicrobiales bacterium]
MAATKSLELLQGTLDLLVLKALAFGPQHGYGVARFVRETTNGRIDVEEGALYTALHRLERRGLVEAEWGVSENNRRAKYYALTGDGRRALRQQTRTWTEYAEAVFMVLRAEGVSA